MDEYKCSTGLEVRPLLTAPDPPLRCMVSKGEYLTSSLEAGEAPGALPISLNEPLRTLHLQGGMLVKARLFKMFKESVVQLVGVYRYKRRIIHMKTHIMYIHMPMKAIIILGVVGCQLWGRISSLHEKWQDQELIYKVMVIDSLFLWGAWLWQKENWDYILW